MQFVDAGAGVARWRLVADERHRNRGGVVHGGAIATLIDTVIGNAVGTVRREGEIWQVAVDLTVVFLERAQLGQTLIGEGQVVRRGRRMAYGEATVTCGDVLIARGHSSYVIFRDSTSAA
jgi:acyl-CoA thioesterase